jgi:hypothetical protein
MSNWPTPASWSTRWKQKRELRRQRVARDVGVKALEERILLRPLEELLAADVLREHVREARLAGADRSLDDDIAALVQVHRIF